MQILLFMNVLKCLTHLKNYMVLITISVILIPGYTLLLLVES